MNLQRRNVTAARVNRGKKEQKSWAFKFCVLMYLLVVASVFFGALNYRIDLNRKITELQRASGSARRDIKRMELDIQALKVQREHLTSWENVSKRIAECNLPLRPAEPQQIRYVAFKRSSTQDTAVAVNHERVNGNNSVNISEVRR